MATVRRVRQWSWPARPRAAAEHLQAAATAARGALPGWAGTPAPARGEILFKAANLLFERAEIVGADLAREEGKTLAEGIGETRRAASILRYFAGQTSEPIGEVYASATPGTRLYTQRGPVGVVATITPWNFPIAIPAWKIAPALAYGNTVLFKPATATPLTANHLVAALVDAGLPAGVLAMVFADGASVTEHWIDSGAVDASASRARRRWAGGSRAAAGAAPRQGAAGAGRQERGHRGAGRGPGARRGDDRARRDGLSAGQKCTATSRVIAIGERGGAAARGDRGVAGNASRRRPDRPRHHPGAGHRRAPRATASRAWSRTRRPRAPAGDPAPEVPARGAFHPATVLEGVTPDMRIANDEVFGPVVGILPAADLDEAIRLHNAVAYGLSGSIFTRDLATAETFIATARVGLVHVNGETAGAEPHVPFGGMKGSSSWSREQGKAASDFYTQTKTVYWDGGSQAGLFDFIARDLA